MGNIKIEREMDVHLQFLLCGYNGSGYSSLISVEKQVRDEVKVFNRILINAGDGTQRICSENRIKLFAVSTVIITSLCPQNLSGFSGVFLSLSDLVLSFLLPALVESFFLMLQTGCWGSHCLWTSRFKHYPQLDASFYKQEAPNAEDHRGRGKKICESERRADRHHSYDCYGGSLVSFSLLFIY